MSVPRSDAGEGDDAQDASPPLTLRVDESYSGERLDKALAQFIPDISRSRLQQWIVAGAVLVNGRAVIARHALTLGDVVQIEPQPAPDAAAFTPEPMPLDVVYEDDAILVLNKPPKLVVHPAAGHWSGTLLNGLLAYAPALAEVPRAGIVHRLDADTSGLMVVAKTLSAQTGLVRQLQARSVTREYWAVVLGVPARRGVIDAAIGRDPRNPLRFKASTTESARPARTHYARIDSTRNGAEISWLACRLETGRTHQIRVHLEHVGHPLIGDPLYRRKLPPRGDDSSSWNVFDRQALHACRLSLIHPITELRQTWFQRPAPDLAQLMHELGFGPLDVASEVFE